MIPPADMTRSFINPKDRAAAVIRRRQEAEEELQRRREERIRQIQEKSENAVKRKQMGLKEKISKTKTETEHLNEVNKRRLEREILERQRLQQLLQKKRSPPRSTATSIKPKVVVAFGSGVPRRLDISTGSGGRSASSSSGNGSLNNTANSLMTRSFHPVMNPAKEKQVPRSTMRPTLKTFAANKPPIKPTNNRLILKSGPASSPRKSTIENRMTRSVHPELCPTPSKRFEKVQTSKPLFVAKKLVGKTVEIPSSKKIKQVEVEVTKPIIEIKEPSVEKIVIDEPIIEDMNIEIKESIIEEPIIEVESVKQEPNVEKFKDEVEPTPNVIEIEPTPNVIDIEPIPNLVKVETTISAIQPTEPTQSIEQNNTEFGEIFDIGSNDEISEIPEVVPPAEFAHNRSSSDDHDSTRTRTISPHFSDDEQHDSGVVPETPSPPLTKIDTSIIAEEIIESTPSPKTNHLFLLNSNNSHISSFTENNNSNGNGNEPQQNNSFNTTSSTNHIPSDPEQTTKEPQTNGLTTVGGGVVIGLADKLQQERENRRAKLNEILSRTRDSSNSASPVKTNAESDASSLAKSLLAKRGEKLNESTNKQIDETQNIPNGQSGQMTLAEEFENLGISKQDQFLLPGQIDSHNNGVSG